MSFFGINLAPLGKKLQEYEGDVGRFFGGAPAQAPAPAPTMPQRQAAANIGAAAGFGPAPAPMQMPTIAPPPPPPKPKVTLSSAQQRAAATLKALGGPVDPNTVSANPGIGDVALAAAKGVGHTLIDPVVNPYNEMNAANAQVAAHRQPGLMGAAKATLAETGNFAKAIGKSGANAAAYVAPELRLLKAAPEASALVKAGIGLINHGASSAPISVAGSLANGDTNPVDIAKNAAIATLTAGLVPGLKDAGVNHLPATTVHAAGPKPHPLQTELNNRIAQNGILKNVEIAPNGIKDTINNQPAPTGVDVTTRTLKLDPTVLQGDLNHLAQGKGIELPDGSVMRQQPGETPASVHSRYLDHLVNFEESHVTGASVGDAQAIRSGQITPNQLDQKAVAGAKPKVSIKKSAEAPTNPGNALATSEVVSGKEGANIPPTGGKPKVSMRGKATPQIERINYLNSIIENPKSTQEAKMEAMAERKTYMPGYKGEPYSKQQTPPKQEAPKGSSQKGTQSSAAKGPKKDWADGDIPPTPPKKGATAGGADEPPISEKQRTATGKNNPVKVNIAEVAKNDHAKAVSNKQRAEEMVHNPGKRAVELTRKLTPEDDKLMPRAIENPELVKTAKEPEKLQKAIDAHKLAMDTAHAANQELKGEPTAYRSKYAIHDWNLPEDMKPGSDSFKAVNEGARLHPTIEHGEANGLKLKDRSYADAQAEYYGRAAHALGNQALIKGIKEADAGAELTHHFNGEKVSAAAKKALQGVEKAPEKGKVAAGYDKSIKTLKQTLLSLNQFHPINIARKAGSTMVGTGHPLNAAKGVIDTFRSINKHYSDGLQEAALKDGTYDDAARIGTPIGTQNDYTVSGKFEPGKHGVGERTIFEQQMPALHIQMVKSVIADLKKRNISLDSPEARQAGNRVNEIMGFVNQEVRGLNPARQRFLSRILLAPQFTRSKWATLKGVATDQGLARKYAIAAVLGDTAAVYVAQTAVGMLWGQKEDNWRDTLIRALIHPSIVTPFKDDKGNNIEVGLPSTYISEAFGLLGKLDRNKDGRLTVNMNPSNIPGNVENYGRARLNVPASAALKVATNTDYAGKQLFDPSASAGNKVKQAAGSIVAGTLPIGTQPFVKPNASINPWAAAAISVAGGSLRTDKTIGKGLGTTQYFDAINNAKLGANKDDATTIDKYSSRQVDPSTGQNISAGVVGGHDNATMLLDNAQKGGQALQKLYDEFHKTNNPDPLWKLPLTAPKGQPSVTAYLTYQAQYEGPEKTGTKQALQGPAQGGWLDQLTKDRTDFYNSQPKGPGSKPPITNEPAYPAPSATVQANLDAYNKISNDAQKAAFLKAHPEVTDQFAQSSDWTNKIRALEHAPEIKGSAKPDAATQAAMDAYNKVPLGGGSKGGNKYRAQWIQANPAAWTRMTNYLATSGMNSLRKNAVESVYAGQDSQTLLKDIKNVGTYDITKSSTLDANGNPTYGLLGTPGAGPASTTSSGSSGGGGGSHKYYTKMKKFKSYAKGGGKGKVKLVHDKDTPKVAVAGKTKSGKPKVSIKPSLV